MATYPFKVSGACASIAKNVFKVRFSQPLSSVPSLRAYDNDQTFPNTGALTSNAFVIFAGSTGNSNESMLIMVDTTRGRGTGSQWFTGAQTGAGGFATVRMFGDTTYLQFRYSSASMIANASLFWNALLEVPSDVNPTMSRLHDVTTRYTFTSTIPVVEFFANNADEDAGGGGTDETPAWGTITTDSEGVRFGSTLATRTSVLANIPLSGLEITRTAWVAQT